MVEKTTPSTSLCAKHGLKSKFNKINIKNKMAVMKRDVNLVLLLLIAAALLIFSGFTVYYQTTFKNVSKSFEIKLKELESVGKELESKRSQLNETSVQLQLKKQKEEDLSQKFTDVRSERDQLESDKKKLETELSSTKSQLAATSAELSNTKSQLVAQIQLAQELNRQVNNLKSDVTKLDKKVKCLTDNIDANEGTC